MSTIVRISSRESGWKMMMSSTRLMNSGRKCARSASITSRFTPSVSGSPLTTVWAMDGVGVVALGTDMRPQRLQHLALRPPRQRFALDDRLGDEVAADVRRHDHHGVLEI